MLLAAVGERVVGNTNLPNIDGATNETYMTFRSLTRGDVERRKPVAWAALDDDN